MNEIINTCYVCMDRPTTDNENLCDVCGNKVCAECFRKINKCPMCRNESYRSVKNKYVIVQDLFRKTNKCVFVTIYNEYTMDFKTFRFNRNHIRKRKYKGEYIYVIGTPNCPTVAIIFDDEIYII